MSTHADSDWQEPNEVHLTRIDVPFLDLTWFFVKASMAMAVAFLVTSWLWVVIGTGVVALSSGLLLLLGVPGWFAPDQPIAAASAPPVMLIAPAPVPIVTEPPPVQAEPEPTLAPPPPVDANAAATEAMQRAELERLRRERDR